MTLPSFVLDKLKPFIDSFGNDVKSKLDAVDKEFAAKGLLASGAQIKKHHSEFLLLLSGLINKITEIIFKDMQNKQLGKPEFSALRGDVEALIQPLIDQFKIGFDVLVRRLISKTESANRVINDFDNDLLNQLNKQFVDVEQNFDAIQ